ncbi:MAG: TAT-variant-translocated molybdopterin oxidoreductase [Verrucomicrobiota bacterium]|jgi:molybdopterin-containing oxidoreductase family iron-sulfur binding subunit
MSKKVFEHPVAQPGEPVGPSYWRSLDERNKTPEFRTRAEREFVDGAAAITSVERREFLMLMGASFGLAGLGLAGCREPRNHTLPYSKQPENTIPGVPTFYASSFPGEFANQPILVETHQHRPTKIEGNPSHHANGGSSSKYAQASVLDMYDPDRAQSSYGANGAALSVAEVRTLLASLATASKADAGAGLAFLARPSTSPTRARLVAGLKSVYPKARWIEYTPVAQNRAEAILGARVLPDYAKARRVLSLDRDFFGMHDTTVEDTRAYSSARRADSAEQAEKMTRLYVVESTFTLTGAAADHRLRASTSHISALAALFAAEVLAQTGNNASGAALKAKVSGVSVDEHWVKECVADLVQAKGSALIVAGDHLTADAHRAVFLANQALGAAVKYVAAPAASSLAISALSAKPADTLIILGGNPAYDGPSDAKFVEAVKAAKKVVRLGYFGAAFDETSSLVKAAGGTVLASSHYLESWSDGRTINGTYVPVQPMIDPLFATVTELDVLAPFAGTDKDAHALVRETFNSLSKSASDEAFAAWLAEGVLAHSEFAAAKPAVSAEQIKSLAAPALSLDSLEVRILPSVHAGDGSYANNGWLAEAPDPMSKTCWENVILISPKLAAKLAVEPTEMVINKIGALNRNINQLDAGRLICHVAKLTVDGYTVQGPVFIMPGLADNTIGVQLGFGRTVAGRVATRVDESLAGRGTCNGFDVYGFVSSTAAAFRTGAKIEITERTVAVCNMQDHWSMEGRDIVREGSVEDMKKNETFAKLGIDGHAPAVYGKDGAMSPADKARTTPRGNSAYEHPNHGAAPNVAVWKGHETEFPELQQWGMSIDLNTCTGCNACVTACQSENNIPVVGRHQVLKGRNMHWIRLDRYFFDGREKAGNAIPEDPQVTFMGVACQHCETAPCETVCPANATVHDDQGLNTMAYNRCIGTRYCANNCPYKVRRFNFLDFNKRVDGHYYEGPLGPEKLPKDPADLPQLQKNPDVSVRMRGVMEKCTYCVQRIQEAKIHAKVRARNSAKINIQDGAIQVACQQACPAGAIEFGDITDPKSRVSKAKASNRSYGALTYLNTRPRTTYQAKLRNLNLRMPGALLTPLSRKEMAGREGHSAAPHGTVHGAPAHGEAHAQPEHGAEKHAQ